MDLKREAAADLSMETVAAEPDEAACASTSET
jgi:hypothetical protein